MAQPLHLTDDAFEAEVIQSPIPVLIDFWATWCGPCRMIAPHIEDLAKEYDGKIKVCKLDVDNNQKTAMRFGVRSIPTVLLLKGGNVVDTVIGAVSKQVFVQKIENALASN
ncbi:MAG: thioredoxin [Ignavibacteria bacterium]|nr:thioredoxin [Ignavibacteria bacterium]